MAVRLSKGKLLFSTCTYLAYYINTRFYKGTHFVWCTSAFDAPMQPGTSNPRTLCMRFLEQIAKNDRHAIEIDNNRAGIIKGAAAKRVAGVITEEQERQIQAFVSGVGVEFFYPVVYIIDRNSVKARMLEVPQKEKASDLSIEYIIEDLKRSEFEIISFRDVLSGVIYSEL